MERKPALQLLGWSQEREELTLQQGKAVTKTTGSESNGQHLDMEVRWSNGEQRKEGKEGLKDES